RLDYSKWDHIEISDDEDETHPNIDTPSLFRWRHQARVDRMEEQRREREELEKKKQDHKKKVNEVQQKLKSQNLSEAEASKVTATKEQLAKQEEEFRRKEQELTKKEKEQPWNIDTICKDGFSKSAINKKPKDDDKNKTEEEIFEEQKKFQEDHKKQLQHFGMLSKAADSKKYLQDNPHLINEKTANYLVIWCIDLQVEEKTSLMEQVAHQTIVLQFILQLALKLDTDPRNCFNAFFTRFEAANADYMESFNDELNSFKKRVKERADIRIQEAMKRYEEEERQKMGPGGLHPGDVMESLPQALRDCFEKQDIPMLQKVVAEMDPEEAKYHIKRCVDSGLWVPNANAGLDTGEDADTEEVYEEVDSSEPQSSEPLI
uniref:Hsp90 chaperone protein kinase-targeting subunit n=1 Tax=Ciona savignyi TaxID=51511 RepID=H2YUR8_CIOSA